MNFILIKQYAKHIVKSILKKEYLYNGELRQYQIDRMNEIIKYAKENSKFYANFYKDVNFEIRDINDIKKLPILKKEIFKKAVQEDIIISSNFDKNDLISGHTTGSTGIPLKMSFDKECVNKRSVVQSRLWNNMGILPYKRFVKIWRDKELSVQEKILKDAGLILPIAVGDVNEPLATAITNNKIQEIIQELVNFKPQVIRGYVSALYSIANILENSEIKLTDLESVVTSAEYLPNGIWEYFERVFNCPIYNLYGGTEAPAIGVNSKENHNIIISEDLYFIEVLDENGNDVKPGEQGLITITDLYSKAMPLIRYQIGDMAIIDENFYHFSEKFRYFVSVEGRTNDIFELEDGSLIYSHLWYIYFRGEDWIDRFCVIQHDKRTIEIQLVVKAFNNKQIDIFKKKISSIFNGVDLLWTFVDKLPSQSGGKQRAVMSFVQNKFNLVNKENI